MVITLIGMPASGKTSMGKMLSQKLHMKMIDGDRLIEAIHGKKLHEIISEVGNEGFKKIEEEALLSIDEDNVIVSPGGSAVYYESYMKKSKERGPVIYLYASPETLLIRLGDFSKRGIVLPDGFTIKDLYNERAPLFEKYADITINCDGQAYSKYRYQTVSAVKKYISKMNKELNSADK
ncbi:MAG: shikimate kinase [Clostridia bacterium]|nr:shikimate kinase [Clostridia bacterium]